LNISLRIRGIDYLHCPELGGFRKEGYTLFAKSKEFSEVIDGIIEYLSYESASILCAESLCFHCHRKFVVESLDENGPEVIHIIENDRIQEYKTTLKAVEEKMGLVIWCDKKA
jgi:uncharacterized protein (DUF488 family)